jgi:hypothetical protein
VNVGENPQDLVSGRLRNECDGSVATDPEIKFDRVPISDARLAFYAGRASSAYGIYE